MKQSLFLISLFIFQLSFSQNLVLNPSFENRTVDFCGIMNYSDLAATIDDWYSPTQSSPDLYFTTIDSTCYNYMPNSSYSGPVALKGSQLPRTGDVMAGIFTYTIAGLEQREYLQVPLISQLNIDEFYVVECYVSLADDMEFSTNQLGIYLSTQPVSLQSNGVLNFTPQVISNNVITETQNWVLISDTIKATDAFSYLTIGNFSSDAQTTTVPNTSSSSTQFYGSFYFIDDVRVNSVRTLNTTDEFINSEKKLLKILDFMGRETEFKPNTPLIYIYEDGTSKRVQRSE